jgi:DNA helicase HerA-like ATPase
MDNIGKIAYMLDKAHLFRLEKDYRIQKYESITGYGTNIRALQVKRCVIDKEESVIDCFKNILGLFAGGNVSLALVINHTKKQGVEMYYTVKINGGAAGEDGLNAINLLDASIKGNLPGTETDIITEDENQDKSAECLFPFDSMSAVSVLANIPTEKSEDFISQGLEKLLDGIVPQSDKDGYSVVLLAEPISLLEIRNILTSYEELATAITPFAGYQFQAGENETKTQGEMRSLANTEGISHAISKTKSINVGMNAKVDDNFGISGSYGYSWGKTETTSHSETVTTGTNESISLGKSESSTYTYKSYLVHDLIAKIEATIKRIDESKANGLWRYGAYVFAKEAKTSENVANYLRSISQGETSYIESSAIQTWTAGTKTEDESFDIFAEVSKYIKHFTHPLFKHNGDDITITPTFDVSTLEVAKVFAFPRHSVNSLPVIECVRFGREPHSLTKLENDLRLGCAYHMHQSQEAKEVLLNRNELTKHTFITGSTGSGKSNTIYKLLEELCLKNGSEARFLVIEPAKGEYKDVLGGYKDGKGEKDVAVYGTNPFKFPNLLQINPFSFPTPEIHVLEHIDRLVEVFNACWPMYAAMPAILKEAVEKAYVKEGWSLKRSENTRNPQSFPTFATLLAVLPDVIEKAEYSKDTSSDYKGALKTRIHSLTIGIQGQIFEEDIPSSDLFDKNAIIDISRVGSSETKALIMGILVLKLQEYRMSENKGSNQKLRHITVLEEAHNLLRRTSSEQSQESSNLQGKSVEMLANAIAEMRTYGEGFIIADQSPGLMDMSVIRNTNTKIIMRLPDESDRVLVGKAAGLSDNQIAEIARLGTGVAAISQSGWLEPVLAKVDEHTDKKPLKEKVYPWEDKEAEAVKQFLNVAFGGEKRGLSAETVDEIRKWSKKQSITNKAREVIDYILENKSITSITEKQQMSLFRCLFRDKLGKWKKRSSMPRKVAESEVKKLLIDKFDFAVENEVISQMTTLYITNWTELGNRIKERERANSLEGRVS